MADGTTTPAQSSPTAAPDPLGKGKLPDMFAQYDQTSANIDKIEAGEVQQQKTLEGERQGLGPLPQPPAQQPMPKSETTSPQQAWASAAMLLAALGSRFSRQPLTTAMNAAAGVLNAYHEGDMAKANVAFQNWKASNDYAMKMYQYELDARKDALADIDRREHLIESDTVAQEREVMAKYNALDAAFGRTGSFALGGERNAISAQREVVEQERVLQQMRDAADKAEVVHTEIQALGPAMEELKASDKFKKADPIEQGVLQAELLHKVAPEYAKSNPTLQDARLEQGISIGVQNSPVGKAYAAAIQNQQTVNSFPDGGGVIPQAALQDAYTQLINGGRAIRGFQARMNTEHAGLFDKAEIELNKALSHGGSLSSQMISDIKLLSTELAKERRSQMDVTVEHAKARASRMGLDPENVVPDIYRSDEGGGQDAGAGPVDLTQIPAEAIKMLKANPKTKDKFDQIFGNGAAEQVLGQ